MKFKKNFLYVFLFLTIFALDYFSVFASEIQNILPDTLPIAELRKEEFSEYKNDEIIVQYKKEKINPKTFSGKIKKTNLENEAKVSEQEKLADTSFVYEIEDGSSVEEKVLELKKNSAVEIAQPNYIYKGFAITPPNDPGWPSMWAMNNIGQLVNEISGTSGADIKWLYAWDKYINDTDSQKNPVIVAVIDSGFYYNHSDLNTVNLWDGSNCKDENGIFLGGCQYGYDYDYNKKDPFVTSMDTHGTMTGGILAATIGNGVGVTGAAPNVRLMSIKADMQSIGEPGSFDTVTIVKAIRFAEQNEAEIINMSFGEGGGYDFLLAAAIDDFSGLVVASAGNDSSNNEVDLIYPCNFSASLSNVICVAATDQDDNLADFSNYGTNSVNIAAPGDNIDGLYYDPDGVYRYAYGGGTSFSAPYVSALASLILGYDNSLNIAQIKNTILNTGDVKSGLGNIQQIDNGVDIGGRRINAYSALLSLDPLLAILSGMPDLITANDFLDITVSGSGITSYKYSIDGGDYSAAISVDFHISNSNLAEGYHEIDVIGIDALGNEQDDLHPTSFSWTINTDIIAPTFPTELAVF